MGTQRHLSGRKLGDYRVRTWDRVLYNQSAKRLRAALVGREHTVIADVPYRRGH